jgi:hypothetical protein
VTCMDRHGRRRHEVSNAKARPLRADHLARARNDQIGLADHTDDLIVVDDRQPADPICLQQSLGL